MRYRQNKHDHNSCFNNQSYYMKGIEIPHYRMNNHYVSPKDIHQNRNNLPNRMRNDFISPNNLPNNNTLHSRGLHAIQHSMNFNSNDTPTQITPSSIYLNKLSTIYDSSSGSVFSNEEQLNF